MADRIAAQIHPIESMVQWFLGRRKRLQGIDPALENAPLAEYWCGTVRQRIEHNIAKFGCGTRPAMGLAPSDRAATAKQINR